jgi:hypothetical protein
MKNKLPKWFKGEHYPKGDIVKNPFTGESYELSCTELSMYDFIKGAEYTIHVKGGIFSEESSIIQREMAKGLDWFRKNNAKAYMVLLD